MFQRQRVRLAAWIALVLVLGFLGTSLISYQVSRNTIRASIAEQELPLTSDNIYSEIQKDILRPVFISAQMAHDTFLRDWAIGGERDVAAVTRYLKEIRDKNGTITAFFISERSRSYYHVEGINRVVREDDPRDKWYFRVRTMKEPYETNIDPDQANRDTMTIFINYRVFDYAENYIGITGVGLALTNLRGLLSQYEKKYGRRVFFVDKAGAIALTGEAMRNETRPIREIPGLDRVADQLLGKTDEAQHVQYVSGANRATVQVNSRYIPELGWYLLVEKEEDQAVQPLKRALYVNLGISALATLLVLTMTLIPMRRYQRRLEHSASTDSLTGVANRQAAEAQFVELMRQARASDTPIACIVFDVDAFKQINDQCGHAAGDMVIRDMAKLAQQTVRESDVVARWGGEEFLVLLKGCTLDTAAKTAEKLRTAVLAHDFALGPAIARVTVSAGVAQYAESETLQSLVDRADKALYAAKQGGRDRVERAADVRPAA